MSSDTDGLRFPSRCRRGALDLLHRQARFPAKPHEETAAACGADPQRMLSPILLVNDPNAAAGD